MMTKRQALRRLGSIKKVAEVCGVTVQAVSQWELDESIPPLRVYQIREYLEREKAGK